MTGLLAAASVVLSLAGSIPAITGVLGGGFRPQVLSWAGWTAAQAIGGTAELAGGQLSSAAYVLACAAGCAAVTVLALRIPAARRDPPFMVPLPAGRRIRLDLICLPGAVAGLVLLAAAGDTGMSVGVSVATDVILFIPTYAHAFRLPQHEALAAYVLFGAGSACALAAAARDPGMTGLGYVAYLTLADGGCAALILARRRARTVTVESHWPYWDGLPGTREPAPAAPVTWEPVTGLVWEAEPGITGRPAQGLTGRPCRACYPDGVPAGVVVFRNVS